MADGPAPDAGTSDGDRHDERHELLVASLLDRDESAPDRAVAEGLLTTCPACAGLHADLVALSAATRELLPAARPRDFRLTAADASRLASVETGGGEPHRATARLTGEMHVPNAGHDRHDGLFIASLLDRTSDVSERERANALIAACSDCADLLQDLLLLRDATRDLPIPPRPRSFTLSTDDAARQRRTGWRRLVAAFGSTRDVFSRPLAIGLTTIGLAGLLVSTASGLVPTGGATSAPTVGGAFGGGAGTTESIDGSKLTPASAAQPAAAPSAGPQAVAAAPVPTAAPSEMPAAPAAGASAAPSAESFDTFAGTSSGPLGAAPIAPEPDASAQRDLGRSTAVSAMDVRTESTDPRLAVIVLAGLLLLVGLALFALRWAARRV